MVLVARRNSKEPSMKQQRVNVIRAILSRYLSEGRFGRNVLILMSGTIVAQGVELLFVPILTRLYTSSDFGILALFFSITNILGILVVLGYPRAIVLPAEDKEAISLFKLSVLIALVASGLSLLAVILFRGPVTRLLGAPGLAPWLWVLPINLLMVGLTQIYLNWWTRQKQFRCQALSHIAGSATMIGNQILSGVLIGSTAGGLIVGRVLGQGVRAGILWVKTLLKNRIAFGMRLEPQELKRLASRYKKFPFFTMPGSLFNQAVSGVPIFLLSMLYGVATVGFFFIARKVLVVPVSLVSSAVSRVFYQRLAILKNSGKPGYTTIIKTFLFLFVLAIIPMGVLFLIAPWLFGLVFGAEWVEAGRYVQALLPMYLLKFSVTPVTQTFLVYEKQDKGLIWQFVYFVVAITGLVIGALVGGPFCAILFYSVAAAFMYLVVLLLSIRWSGGLLSKLPYYLLQELRFAINSIVR